MLYSFDVFDTLITRKTATPKGIFAIMQHRLQENENYRGISKFIRDNFFDIRVNSEELARLNYFHGGIEEITLEEIYDAVGTITFIDKVTKEILINLEKVVEMECVVGVDENINHIKSLLQAGKRVVLISDMYLDEATIRKMLVSVDDIFGSIPLYVSSKFKKGKWTSSLFHIVREKEKADFQAWVHTGDNIHTDINVPVWLGIKVHRFALPELLPMEEKILQGGEDKADVQLMLGAARQARLQYKWNTAGRIGTSFAGEVLFPYVQWLLEQCQLMRIYRLYFIARDGYILKKIADIIIAAWHLPIETHYFYASRRSLRMPAYDGTEEAFRRILTYTNPTDIKSVRAFASTLRIEVEKLLEFLPRYFRQPDKKIDYKAVCYIAKYLGSQKKFRDFLVEYHKEARRLAQAYLFQEVNCSDEAFAFVDLNGSGFSAGSMCSLLRERYTGEVRTFFYKLDRIGLAGDGIVYNFCPGAYKYDLLLELLCRAVHGQTNSYRKEEDKIVPVLSDWEDCALREYGYEEYMAGIETFCRLYAGSALKEQLPASLSVSLKCLHYAVDEPDEEMRDFFADMPFNRSGRNGELTVFAPKLNRDTIRNIFILHRGTLLEKYYNGANFEYSLFRCTEVEKKKIKFYEEHWFEITSRFNRLHPSSPPCKFEREINKCINLLSCQGDRILLYGAGNFGKALYKSLLKLDKVVVGWLDKEYLKLQGDGYPVMGDASVAGNFDFDVVLVAAILPKVIAEIKDSLMANGVPSEQIWCVYDEEIDYLPYLDM